MAAYKNGTQSLGTRKINSSIPAIGTTFTTNAPLGSSLSQFPAIGQSYNKMIGVEPFEGSGFSGSSMGQLEAASMRLADAASRRNIAEKEAEQMIEAKKMGYSSLEEMQRDIRKKRKKMGM